MCEKKEIMYNNSMDEFLAIVKEVENITLDAQVKIAKELIESLLEAGYPVVIADPLHPIDRLRIRYSMSVSLELAFEMCRITNNAFYACTTPGEQLDWYTRSVSIKRTVE